MSQATAHQEYLPQDHAPDPLFSHGDPTPPGKIAIWLFLASEIMFFVALLGSYIVLRAGSPHLFSAHAAALSKPLAAINTLVLIFSSLTMALSVEAAQQKKRGKLILFLTLTILCAASFMTVKGVEYASKYYHHTIVARDGTKFYVYDGHQEERDAKEVTLQGYRMPLGDEQAGVNVHLISQQDVATHPHGTEGEALSPEEANKLSAKTFKIPVANINTDLNYLPWKNIFYSCYFVLTGVHGIHVLAGMIPLSLLLIQAIRGKMYGPHTEYVGLYWHFVDLVWIFLFPLLYLI